MKGGVVSQETIEKLIEYHNEPTGWWLVDGELVHCKESELNFVKEIITQRKGE